MCSSVLQHISAHHYVPGTSPATKAAPVNKTHKKPNSRENFIQVERQKTIWHTILLTATEKRQTGKRSIENAKRKTII